MSTERYKWKGRFKLERNGKKNRKDCNEDVGHKDNLVPVEGIRLVDIQHMAKTMFCSFCKKALLLQNIEHETLQGTAPTFHIRCKKCLKLNLVNTAPSYESPATGKLVFTTNTKAALGAMHAGFGATQLSKFLSVLDAPSLDPKTFKKHERLIGPVIELIANESCSEATALKRMLTVENIEELKNLLPTELQEEFLIVQAESSDSNNKETIVRIFASYDMGWSQRGNGAVYDSLNGYCALIGLKSGKVLDYCTKNRKCKACESGIHKDTHDCRLNFTGSSKAMEAAGAVQLVANSTILKNANTEVGVLIGDNDNNCMAALKKEGLNYILKQSNMNHTTKGVGNILYEIKNNKQADPDRELTKDCIKHIQRCFTYAIQQNKGDAEKIQVAIKNIPFNIFGHHENCRNWCKNIGDKENYSGIQLIPF